MGCDDGCVVGCADGLVGFEVGKWEGRDVGCPDG